MLEMKLNMGLLEQKRPCCVLLRLWLLLGKDKKTSLYGLLQD